MLIPSIPLLADLYVCFACFSWCWLSWCWSWLKVGQCWLYTDCQYTSMRLYIFVNIHIILKNYVKKKEISIQICKLGNAMNSNEACHWMLMRKMLAGYADPDDSYPGSDTILILSGSIILCSDSIILCSGSILIWSGKFITQW